MKTKLAVIILNYRTATLTINCLASMENEIDDDILVLVIDNNSADGSFEEIDYNISQNNWRGWCRLISSKVNNGFAAGNNIGIRTIEAEAYILLNSDTLIQPGAFKTLRRALELNPGVGIVSPRTEKLDGANEQNTFRYVTPVYEFIRAADTGPVSSLLRKFDVVIEPDNTPFKPQWFGFACVIIRKEVISEVGLLDERYFMYFEDIDYCRRTAAKGWGVLYWPEARVIHLLGKSSNVTEKSHLRHRLPKYYYEARAHYFKKHYGLHGFIIANLLWTAGRCISFLREKIGCKSPSVCEYEFRDIWTGLKT